MEELIKKLQDGVHAINAAQMTISNLQSENESLKVIIHRLIEKHDHRVCTEPIDDWELMEIINSKIIITKDDKVKILKQLKEAPKAYTRAKP